MTDAEPSFLYVEDDPSSRKIMQTLLVRVMKFADLTVFETSANFLENVRALPKAPSVIFLADV